MNYLILMGRLKKVDRSKKTMTLELTQNGLKKDFDVSVSFLDSFVDTEEFKDSLVANIVVRGHLDVASNGIVAIADRITIM